MFSKLLGIGLAIGISAFAIGDANARSGHCEGCSEWQFAEKAKSMGVGEHVLTSFSTGKVALFKVDEVNAGQPAAAVVRSAQSVPVPADLQAAFDQLESLYQQYAKRVRALVQVRADELDVPGLKGANAFQVMSDFNLKSRLGERLAQRTSLALGNIVQAVEQVDAGRFGLSPADSALETTVILADGSQVVYRGPVKSASWQYLQDRSRTKEGNLIPEANALKYQGRWTGSPDELQSLGNYLRDYLNVPVDIPSGVQADRLQCKWDGNTLRCGPDGVGSGNQAGRLN